MKFLDQAKVYVSSGHGGAGCISFHREKFIEYGGPDGGDGGRGGDVFIEGVAHLNTLIDYRYQQHFKAKTGQHGMGKNRTGHHGASVTLKVPIGTQIFAEDKETLLVDVTEVGQHLTLLQGGIGGRGNVHFKSSVNQAPRRADTGMPGQEMWIWLRLKLIADAGLVGLPNAGKSTFLASCTRARPKIADYPFTTLHPQLGVVYLHEREFVVADLPGLIEGAHQGIGLGDRFLGHTERCRILIHLIDGTQDDVVQAYRIIEHELTEYGMGLTDKPQIIGLNKCDALDNEEINMKLQALQAITHHTIVPLSGVSGKGVSELLKIVFDSIFKDRENEFI